MVNRNQLLMYECEYVEYGASLKEIADSSNIPIKVLQNHHFRKHWKQKREEYLRTGIQKYNEIKKQNRYYQWQTIIGKLDEALEGLNPEDSRYITKLSKLTRTMNRALTAQRSE